MHGRVNIDLHVHTGRYSACAEAVAPRDIARHAMAAGLHAVVLTDHDTLWESEELSVLRETSPEITFFRGIECSTSAAHVVMIGLPDAGALTRGIDFGSAVELAREGGAATILAHPYRDGDPEGLPLDEVDAVEIASTSFSRAESVRASRLAARLCKPRVASSDAHALRVIGWAFTEFPRMPRDESELAQMIRAGQGLPSVPRPFLR